MADDGAAATRLIERYWDGLLESEPLLGTAIGDERYDDRLPDPGPDGRAFRERLHRGALEELGLLEVDALDEDLRISLDILEAIARRDLAALEHRTDRLAAVSHLWGPAGLVGELASLQLADTPERVERYAARIAAMPAYYDAELEIMREGIADGVTAPRIVADRALAQTERLIGAGADDSPALAPVGGDDAAGRAPVVEAIGTYLLPALERYREGIRDYLPHATETIGLLALPGGDAMYAAQILSWTTLELGATEVHELGVGDLSAIQEERARSAAVLGHPDAAAAEAAIATDAAFRFASPEDLKAAAEEQVRKSWEAAPSWFGRVPGANCEVRLVEAFREADMPFAFYNPPTEDGSRPGVYYVNGFDLGRKPKHQLASTTYHEANPGPPLPDRARAGDGGAARRCAGSAGSWPAAPSRRDGACTASASPTRWALPGRVGAPRHARPPGDAGGAAGRRHRHPRARMAEGARDRDPRGGGVAERRGRRSRPIATSRCPARRCRTRSGSSRSSASAPPPPTARGTASRSAAFHDRLLALGSLPLMALRRELAR